MADRDQEHVTRLLRHTTAGDGGAESELVDLVWDELRAIAAGFLTDERADHTLQPTALVHEAYLKLFGTTQLGPGDRNVFLGLAARAMRRVLIDHARARATARRGGGWARLNLEGLDHAAHDGDMDALTVHELLERFARVDERAAQVVELRFFGGLTRPEIAGVLGISERTVGEDWFAARAWLTRELRREGEA